VRQQSLATQTGFEKYGRKSKREPFLDEMEQIVPWAELEALVEPHYPKGENGQPPVGLGIMLRMYFLQQWFNLSDPGAEDALYESPVLRGSWESIWGVRRRRTRAPSCSSAICWSGTSWWASSRMSNTAIQYTPVDCIATVRIRHCFSQSAIDFNSTVVHPNRRTGLLSRVGGTAT